MINISGIIKESAVDGPGLRYVIFTQGCQHRCKGCHNPSTWSFTGGRTISFQEIINDIKDGEGLISGVTYSGGEPCEQIPALIGLSKLLKKEFPALNILSFSGYTLEEIKKLDRGEEYLSYLDYLIDGRFVLELRTLDLPFRGSSNQRFIDMKKPAF